MFVRLKRKLSLLERVTEGAKVARVPRGLVARISGFHPEGPGSIPGVGGV